MPILEAFGGWLDEQSGHVLPKSPLGRAITYAQAQWEDLLTYTRDGELSIDNNLSERLIREITFENGYRESNPVESRGRDVRA